MASDPTQRALALLSLLSSRALCTGTELAERLGVTERTVRRDVDRLRSLQYQVDSVGGTGGGYRLRSGAAIPPLFLGEEETIATVSALIVAIGNQSTGMVDDSIRALGKLHHVLPSRLMNKVVAVEESATAVPLNTSPPVDPKFVAALAEGCRNHVGVRFRYRSRDGTASERRVDPASMVAARGVWYLIAFDLDRDDWRLFRIDRMQAVTITGHGALERPIPGGDPMTFLLRSMAAAPYAHTADLRLDVDAVRLREAVPRVNEARMSPGPDGTLMLHLGSDVLDDLVAEIVRVFGAVTVRSVAGSPPVMQRLTALGRGLITATASGLLHSQETELRS